MNRARRAAVDVGVGMTTVVVVTYARRVAALRRLDRGEPVRRTRWLRRVERQRARDAASWAASDLNDLRALLTTSEKASVQLTIWDNARRTSEAMIASAAVVQESLDARSTTERSGRDALARKIADLDRDAAPYTHVASVAQAELAHLQEVLCTELDALVHGAPAQVVAPARRLVASHDTARRPRPGHLDELVARKRLDELSALRESLELTLARSLRPPT